MLQKLALLSTGTGVIPSITAIVKNQSAGTAIVNFVDDGIIKSIAANENVIDDGVMKRLLHLALAADLSGAQAILVTCSSISEFVDYARPFLKLPIYKIDEPMICKAIQTGKKIGVAATVATTLAPTLRQVEFVAAKQGADIVIESRLVEPAFEAFQRGETDLHDQLVSTAIIELCEMCDVVVLAQASMMSVVEKLEQVYKNKVLSSPALGVARVLEDFR